MRDQLFSTRINDLFGIRHPILCGGLIWLADGRYVASVVNAGGMGFITALSFPDPDEFRRQLHLCRELTGGKPFGVNLSVTRREGFREKIAKHIDITIDEQIPFIETSGGSPDWFIDRLKANGCKVIHKVPGLKYIKSVERLPVDAISLVGGEAGGHPGMILMGTMVQAALLRDFTDLPCVVGGGIGTGRQLVAVLSMGVDGVLMGSRMLACEELWAHPAYKERIVAGDGTDTVVRMQTFKDTHRVMPNETAAAVGSLEAHRVTDFEQYRPLVNGQLTRQAYVTGDISKGMIDYGQAVAFADRRETIEQIFDRIMDDSRQAIRTLDLVTRA